MTDTIDREPDLPPPPRAAQGGRVAVADAPHEPTPLRSEWIAAAALGALAFDIGLRRSNINNVGGTIWVLLLAAALIVSGCIKTRTAQILVGLGVCFGVFLSIRTEPRLTTFNVLISIGLLLAAAIHGSGRSIWNWRPVQALSDGTAFVLESVEMLIRIPTELGARARVAKESPSRPGAATTAALLRGIAIAGPVLLVLGLLLASADAVFGAFFSNFGFNVGPLLGHIALLAVGAFLTAVVLVVAASQGGESTSWTAPRIGVIETAVVLVGMNALFGLFAVAQLLTVAGGAEDALERAGVDPKEFARQGFFQLLWVAGITLVVLMVLNTMQADSTGAHRVMRWLSLVTVALTLVIVWVAFTRIGFYIDDEGQTPLRFYSAVFSIWVAVAFVLAACRIWGVRADRAWLMPALAASAIMVVMILNVINPEKIMADDNVAKNHEHLAYHVNSDFRQFSDDGKAVLAASIDQLSPDLGERVARELCASFDPAAYNDGLLHFNRGRRDADRALTALCS